MKDRLFFLSTFSLFLLCAKLSYSQSTCDKISLYTKSFEENNSASYLDQYIVKIGLLPSIKSSNADIEIRKYNYYSTDLTGRAFIIKCQNGEIDAKGVSWALTDTSSQIPWGWTRFNYSPSNNRLFVIYRIFTLKLGEKWSWDEFFLKMINDGIFNLPTEDILTAESERNKAVIRKNQGRESFELKLNGKLNSVEYRNGYDITDQNLVILKKLNNLNKTINLNLQF